MVEILTILLKQMIDKKEVNNDIYKKEKVFEKYIEHIEDKEDNNVKHNVKDIIDCLIRIIIEYLNYKEAVRALEYEYASDNTCNTTILDVYNRLSYHFNKRLTCKELNKLHSVEVNKMPILLNPWNGKRVINNFIDINDTNIFNGKVYNYNVYNQYLYPMNFIICGGGNHSQLAARYKNKGTTIIRAVADFSELYKCTLFDGKGFKDNKTNEYVVLNEYMAVKEDDELYFYAGVLFEIGRYILNKNYADKFLEDLLKECIKEC